MFKWVREKLISEQDYFDRSIILIFKEGNRWELKEYMIEETQQIVFRSEIYLS